MSEPRSSLPPLPALRVFAAFVRLGRVQSVAEELNLTAGAVTYQLRALEAHLGLALLERKGRSLQLSEDGRAYGYRIRQALEDIRAATQELGQGGVRRRGQRQRILRVALLPSFAQGWLLPRLGEFAQAHPDIRLHLEASVSTISLTARRMDCAIRFGHGQWEGVVATPLMGDRTVLLAAPTLASGQGMSLRQWRRLHSSENWGAWAASAGLGEMGEGEAAPWHFNDSCQQLEAARLGLGLALARCSIADAALRRGDLVVAHPHQPDHPSRYHLLRPTGRALDGALADFGQWLGHAAARWAREQGLGLR